MKFIKRLTSARNKAGFTLVEVIVSMALLGILCVTMTAFVGPILNSSVDTEKDVRATIIAETIDAYINRSLQNAKDVSIYTDVDTTELVQVSNDLDWFKPKFGTSALDPNKYEVRCIALKWLEDEKTNQMKYMLTLGKVEKGVSDKYIITQENRIFEDCFYDGVYPDLHIEQVTADDGTNVSALKLTVDIYTDQQMNSLSLSGEGYTNLININKLAASTDIKLTTVGTPSDGSRTSTYIFYIIRKTF